MPAVLKRPPRRRDPRSAATAPPEDLARLEREVILSDHGFLAWFEVYGYILNKKRELVQPEANPFQVRCAEAITYCEQNGIPIRLLKLKPRQKGCSTVSVAELYYLMRKRPMNSVIIGGEYSQVDNLWKILKLYHAKDEFEWPGGPGLVQERTGQWENGSAVQKETARDAEAGRSGTFQGLIATEAARWKEGGAADASAVITGILNCIPYDAGTFAVLESTAAGDYGMFYDYWQNAITIDEHRRGAIPKDWNGFFKIFSPWFEHADSCDRLDSIQSSHILSNLTPDEREMMATYGLRAGHISWYRRTLVSECKRDPSVMKREYPGSPEEAFHAASKRRFNSAGLKVLEAEAQQARPEWGKLEPSERNPRKARWMFRPVVKEDAAVFALYEPPRVGLRYVLSVDTSEGKWESDQDNPDRHCITVLRDGYLDPDRGWRRPKLVAATIEKCLWDMDILAHWVFALSKFFGDCLVVPERNNTGEALIVLLRQMGANLYQSTSDDESRATAKPTTPSGKFGFRTVGGQAQGSRNYLIEKLAQAIREWDVEHSGIEIPDLATIRELKSFVNKKNGRSEAAEGKHDDRVMALGIGYLHLPLATVYARPTVDRDLPADIALAEHRGDGVGVAFT